MSKEIKSLRRRIGSYAGNFTTKLRKSLSSRNNIASKELFDSIKSRVGNKFSGSKNLIVGFEVSFKGYGNFLNRNIHPKRMPSIDAIISWMTVRGIKPRRDKRGRFMSKKQAAYLIARSIQRQGFSNFNPSSDFYKGSLGWLDVVWEGEKKKLRQDVRKDLFQAVRNMTIESLSFSRPTRGSQRTFF